MQRRKSRQNNRGSTVWWRNVKRLCRLTQCQPNTNKRQTRYDWGEKFWFVFNNISLHLCRRPSQEQYTWILVAVFLYCHIVVFGPLLHLCLFWSAAFGSKVMLPCMDVVYSWKCLLTSMEPTNISQVSFKSTFNRNMAKYGDFFFLRINYGILLMGMNGAPIQCWIYTTFSKLWIIMKKIIIPAMRKKHFTSLYERNFFLL